MRQPAREDQFAHLHRTRRNLMAMAAIAGTAILTKTRTASARVDPDDNDGPDGDNDSDDQPQCFLKGTHIRTVRGWRKVEESGDRRPCADGLRRYAAGPMDRKPALPEERARQALGEVHPSGAHRPLGARPGDTACGPLPDAGARPLCRRRAGGGREPHQRHHDCLLRPGWGRRARILPRQARGS